MDMNFDYLNRIFSQFTGNTIFRYLNSLRIKNSKELIATTNLSFGQVGEMVGFSDKYYFSKLFHKETGMTATEYYKRKRRIE
jgi:YesN/AraC family two-component response regulator